MGIGHVYLAFENNGEYAKTQGPIISSNSLATAERLRLSTILIYSPCLSFAIETSSSAPIEDMSSAVQPPSGTTDEDTSYTVWWNEPADQDPENPRSWSDRRKWGIITILSVITFLT